ncbi:MAG: hypothetical protein JST89_01525 [Cyanobacteria bacterium SZAS-4]|nr:hypothetical protein [Cyanobacteria bacterium SZAS-4]
MPPTDVNDNTKKDNRVDDAYRNDHVHQEIDDTRKQTVDQKAKETADKTKELVQNGLLPSCTIGDDGKGDQGKPGHDGGASVGEAAGGLGGAVGGAAKHDSEIKNADGSTLHTNSAGQVTDISYKDGSKKAFTYNDDGTVKEATEKDGSIWRKGDDDKFHLYGKDQKDKGSLANDISVSQDGKVSFNYDQISVGKFKVHVDGTTTYNTDGTSISANPRGEVTAVNYGNGTSRTFKRNDAGEITEIGETDNSTWKHEGDGKWHQYKDDKATGQTNDAVPTVTSDGQYSFKSPDGTVNVRNLDGSSEVQKPDGNSTKTDTNGLLIARTYPDGGTRTFERDDKGKLTEIKNPDGSSWTKDKDTWRHIDSSGKELDSAGYSPRVFADGSFSVASGDGTVYSGHADGTAESKRGDGSTVKYNSDGRVTEVNYPGGAKRSFTYSGDQLTSFTDTNGKTWKANGDQWQLPDGAMTDQKVSVNANGDLTIGNDGGNRNKYLTNGSSLNLDGQDRVTHIAYQDGKQRDFQRDADGNITTITETDGNKWKKESDGKWHEYGKDDKSTGKTNDANPEVDDQGNYKISKPDGTWELRKSDGSIVKSDRKDGMVTEIDYADGKKRQFGYNDKNELVAMIEGNKFTGRDKDGHWKTFDKDNPLDIKDSPQIVQVFGDGTISSYDGGPILTSTNDVTSHPNTGHNLWGEHSDNPLAAITPEAVHQGSLGDCYFLAAVASMADANPQAVKDMIQDNGNGTYTVTFPADPGHPVTVDAPTDHELGAYAHDDQTNGMWVNVLEKAHRKYTGRENSDDGDDPNTGIKLLSPPGTHTTDDDLSGFIGIGRTTKEHVEQDIEKALNNHQLIVASTQDGDWLNHLGTTNDPGSLVSDHVYAVTDYNPETHTVTMRNPWGGNGQEGTFTISLDDFYNKFTDLNFVNS